MRRAHKRIQNHGHRDGGHLPPSWDLPKINKKQLGVDIRSKKVLENEIIYLTNLGEILSVYLDSDTHDNSKNKRS